MPYDISWAIPRRVVHLRISGEIVIEEVEVFDSVLIEHLNNGTAPVHVILEFLDIGRVPLNPQKIISAQQFMNHPTLEWLILVGANQFIRFMAAIVFQIVRVQAHLFETYDEALDFIYNNDPTLSDSEDT